MAREWIEADLPLLYRLILLVEDFWCSLSANGRKDTDVRIAALEQKLGLSPLDRRRLEWELPKAEEPETDAPPAPPQPTGTDPRFALMNGGKA